MSLNLHKLFDDAYAVDRSAMEGIMESNSQSILDKTFGDTCSGQKIASNRPHAYLKVREGVHEKRGLQRINFSNSKTDEEIFVEEESDV